MPPFSNLENTKVNISEVLLKPAFSTSQRNNPAIICRDQQISYSDLEKLSNRAGNVFKDMGAKVGDRVLMLVQDTPAFFFIYLGLLKIGAVPIALNTRLAVQDLRYIILDSEASIVVLDNCFSSICDDALSSLANSPITLFTDSNEGGDNYLGSLMDNVSDELKVIKLPIKSAAIWMYSSGTTGKPKGVVHSHETVFSASRLLGEVFKLGAGDRIYSTSKLFFAFSLAHSFFGSLTLGAATILDPTWPDQKTVTEVVNRFQPTVMLSVPTFYRNLLKGDLEKKEAFQNVKYYLTAGEKLPENIFRKWAELTGRPVLEGIGATETCFLFLCNRPNKFMPGSCGTPTPGTQVKIVDDQGKEIAEAGVPGVLWVKMNCLALGYHKLEDRTKEAFKDGWYCTNDMFIVNQQGLYEHQGRADDMLKISGQWVSPTEIEELVLQDENISEAAVVGVPNDSGLLRLALFLVVPEKQGDREEFESRVKNLITNQLSIYKCPRQFYYVDEMPLTTTGKLKRFALRKMLDDNSPGLAS